MRSGSCSERQCLVEYLHHGRGHRLSIGIADDRGDPIVQLTGRAELVADGWQVTWPGVAWRTSFSGTSVAVVTNDTIGYHVEIDDRERLPIVGSKQEQTHWYRDLAAGRHTIEVIRKRGTSRSAGLFVRFELGDRGGRWLPPPRLPKRQIEFIGDSSSTGYGILSSKVDCDDDETEASSDAGHGYAILTARRLHSDWQLNAMDGIGVVRNWNGVWKDTNFHTYYARTLRNEPTSIYDRRGWHPQVAVIWLGNNDFSTPLTAEDKWNEVSLEQDFDSGYGAIVTELRQQMGPSGLIVAIQPSFDDSPANREVLKVIAGLRARGDRRVFYMQLPPMERTGCDHHPTVADNRLLSDRLTHLIESHTH